MASWHQWLDQYTSHSPKDADASEKPRPPLGDRPQAELDLHGLTREEARRALEDFLHRARQRGLTEVLVIHGWGRHTQEGRGVLKGWFLEWVQGRKDVSARRAPPRWGGAGATLLTLKR